MIIESTFGSDITKNFVFRNYCKKQTTYTCKVLPMGGQKQAVSDPKDKKGGDRVDFEVTPASLQAPPADS